MDKLVKYEGLNPNQIMAIEIKALNYGIKNGELANEVGVTTATVGNWFNNPDILAICLARHRELNDGKAIELKDSLYREGILGNVVAAKTWLEMEGYYDKTLTLKFKQEAPFDAHLRKEDVQEAEIVHDDVNVNDIPLPPRDPKNDNPKRVNFQEKKRIKQSYAKDQLNKDQMTRHYWRKRAKTFGIDMLPPGRPSKENLRKWQNSIIEAEKSFAKGILPDKQKTPD